MNERYSASHRSSMPKRADVNLELGVGSLDLPKVMKIEFD
jgi:hypothetical protein